MHLPLPALAVAVERDLAAELHPRHVDAEQLLPHIVPLARGHVRLFVDDVLEMVDHCAIRDECQRTGQMAVTELARIFAEEALGPRPREELHRHGMDFAALHARPDRGIRHAVAVHPRGKGVARLVRHDLDVVLRAVEVCKNERDFIVAKARAVAAARLARRGQHVHQLIVQHHVEEFTGLGRQLLVEFLPVRQNRIRVAARLRVAAAEHQRVVGKRHRIFLAEPLRLLAVDAVRQRHEVLHHCRAELLHIGLAVAVAPHPVIAERRISAVAELFAHRVAQMHHLIVDVVKLRLMLLVPRALGLPRRQPPRVVRIVLERRQLRDRIHAALKRDLRACDQLAVCLREVVFLLTLGDDLRRERLARDLRVYEHQITVFRRKFLPERAFQHRALPGILIRIQLRRGRVPECLLRVVEFIARVDRVPHAGQRRLRLHVNIRRLMRKERLAGLSIVPRRLQPLSQRMQLVLYRRQIGAFIFHL